MNVNFDELSAKPTIFTALLNIMIITGNCQIFLKMSTLLVLMIYVFMTIKIHLILYRNLLVTHLISPTEISK